MFTLFVPVSAARSLAGAVLLLSLGTLCVAAWVARIGRDGVADSFLVRHADRILPVTSFSPGTTVIDVSDAEALHRVVDRAAQMCGGLGVSTELPIARIAREIRPFRIYDGPSEVHRWSIARRAVRELGGDA